MLLNSLTVAGLRCFRNPVTLTDFDERVNIIFGPNETGKSTLVWGLVLAFCNRYDVGGEGILAYRPWGTDLSPAIEVEFTAAGKCYRLEKGFLDQAKCILSERTGDRYLRLADGKRADERVREFMLARFPGRGLAKGTDWGLAHLLWMPQDKERFTSPSVSRQVEDHFRQAAGATLFTLRDDKLLQLIDDRYAEVFTPKTGQILAKSELNQARVRRQELEEKLKLTRNRLETVFTKVSQLEAKEKQAYKWQKTVQELIEKSNLLSAQVEEVKKLKAQIATVEAEQKAAVERWRSLQQDWDHIEAWAQKSTEAARLVQKKGKELAFIQSVVEKLQQEVATKQAEVAQLAQEVKRTNQQLTRAYKLKQSLAQLAEINKREQDLTAAQQMEKKIVNLKKELDQSLVPTSEHLLEAEKQQRQIEICQGQARTQGLQVDFKPVKDFVLKVITADGKEEYQVGPKRPLNINATSAEMQLEIASVGTVTIKSGAVELKEILSRLATAKSGLAIILQTYQADSVTELREKYDWAQSRQQQITNLQTKLSGLLGEQNSIEQLQQECDSKRQQLDHQCQELGIDAAGLSLVPLPDAAQVEQQTKAWQESQERAQEQLKVVEAEYQQKKTRQQTLAQEISEQNRLIQTASDEQEKCLVHYHGQKEELQQSLQRAEAEKEQKTHLLAQRKGQLPLDADSLERMAARQKQELDQKQKETLKLREEVAGLRAEINLQSQEGLYSKLSELEEEYEIVQSQYRWLAGQARAVKLLYRLVHARHEAMLTSITDPIRQGINGLFQRVTAQPDRSLQLDADLSLAGLRISSEQSLQPLDVFSIGTQEQMLLLARLALAHFLSAGERQLVVLDDALVNSDGHRRQRILNLLKEAAADRLQLLILTCHPDMYQELPGRRYDLAAY